MLGFWVRKCSQVIGPWRVNPEATGIPNPIRMEAIAIRNKKLLATRALLLCSKKLL